jgi:predicted DNA-binding transcriptional regulator YafY
MKHLIGLKDFSSSLLEQKSHDSEHVMLFESFSNTLQILEDAITNKFVCKIFYKGERPGAIDSGYRNIEPYALGVNSKGNTVLRAWLIDGTSRTGKANPKLVPGWRLFRVDRISEISVTLQNFTVPRKGYNSQDKGMTEISFAADF